MLNRVKVFYARKFLEPVLRARSRRFVDDVVADFAMAIAIDLWIVMLIMAGAYMKI